MDDSGLIDAGFLLARRLQTLITAAEKSLAGFVCVGVDENGDVCGETFTCPPCTCALRLRAAVEQAKGGPKR